MLSGELRNQKRWDLRRISERFVVHFGQSRDHVPRFVRRYVILGVVRAKMCGNPFGMIGFVIAGLVETDRECLNRTITLLLHERADE